MQREVPRLLENPLQPLRLLQLGKVPNVEFDLDERSLIRPGLLGSFFPIGERGARHNAFCGVDIALEHPEIRVELHHVCSKFRVAALVEDLQQLVNGKIPLHVRHEDEPPALRPERYKLVGDMAHGRVRLARANRASQQKQPALLRINAYGLAQNPLNPRALPSLLRFRHTYLQSFPPGEQGTKGCSGKDPHFPKVHPERIFVPCSPPPAHAALLASSFLPRPSGHLRD